MNERKEAVITAVFVNQPKPGKKNGTIKADGDVLFLAKPPILAQFQQGGRYKIAYEEYNIAGNNFKEIKDVTQEAPPQAVYHGGGDSELAERIFVCGAINATFSNPNVNINSSEWGLPGCINLVNHWRKVWAATFGTKTIPASKDDMNDDIPY